MQEQHFKRIQVHLWLPTHCNISNVFSDQFGVNIFDDNIILLEKERPKVDEEKELDEPAFIRNKNKK